MTIFFPLTQTENAAHQSHETLLPVDIYTKLHLLIEAAADANASNPRGNVLAQQRTHRAVLIDGARGTGKSSILVNLGTYLRSTNPKLLNRVHIFKPVDPTLLEDHDDLFLNVIVAAMLSDETVKNAQIRDADGRHKLQHQLQSLGHALESMQGQREQQGLDKIRSFIGNQQLVEEVHKFFDAVRNLIGMDLLVLTIDDVDTSLNRAFENMEVVRRYLVTPYVLPIISGDQDLYQEVTWRDFHGRLLRDSNYRKNEAYVRAVALATEYQRKILPMQYRLRTPSVPDYLKNGDIQLGEPNGTGQLPLPLFAAWLDVLVNGPVNGQENSHLHIPIPVVRALAQLINRLGALVPELARRVKENNLDALSLRRALLIPGVKNEALDQFMRAYRIGSDNSGVYLNFVELVKRENNEQPALLQNLVIGWRNALLDYFRFDPAAGPVFLVLQAHAYWSKLQDDQNGTWRSVFDTPLFQPLNQSADYSQFTQDADLMDWAASLQGRAPQRWINTLPAKAILPYPVPEAGKAIPNRRYTFEKARDESELNFLLDLVLHRNFYSSNKRAQLICTGRIFELLVSSLLRDLNENDILMLLERPPFYSFSGIAGTKTMDLAADTSPQPFTEPDQRPQDMAVIMRMVEQINAWRVKNDIAGLSISPWLIYNVFNKTINQAWLFNKPLNIGEQPREVTPSDIVMIARQTFFSLWSAFGSFEKGQIFGLPEIVANVNIGSGMKFEYSDLYRQNIAPFYSADGPVKQYGETVRAITALLGEHPLKLWLEKSVDLENVITNKTLDLVYTQPTEAPAAPGKRLGPRAWLRTRLGLTRLVLAPDAPSLQKALTEQFPTRTEALLLLEQFTRTYPSNSELRSLLTDAVNIAYPEQQT